MAKKSRKKILWVVLGLVGLVIVGLVVAGLVLHPGKYSDHGVELSYPSNWIRGNTQFAAQSGSALWSESFSPTSNNPEGVTVSQYKLNADVSSVSPDALKAELTTLVQGLASQLNGTVAGDLTPVQVGGLQGFEVTINGTVEGKPMAIDLTLLFKGTAQYNIGCQATAANQTEVTKGCQQVKSTFVVK